MRHSAIPQWADDLQATINHIHDHVVRLDHKVNSIMAAIDDIKAKLDAVVAKATANTDALDSIGVILTGLKSAVDTLNAKVAELQAIIDAGGSVDLAPIAAGLDALSTKLDEQATKEAVLTNTPAAPPVP